MKMRAFIIIIVGIVISCYSNKMCFANSDLKLAIIEIDSDSLTSGEKELILEKLIQELSSNKNLKMISQAEIDSALKTNIKKQSYFLDTKNSIKLGKKLEADQVVNCLVIKMKNLCVITVKLVDIKYSDFWVMSSSSYGSFDKFLNTSVSEVAQKISKRIE